MSNFDETLKKIDDQLKEQDMLIGLLKVAVNKCKERVDEFVSSNPPRAILLQN